VGIVLSATAIVAWTAVDDGKSTTASRDTVGHVPDQKEQAQAAPVVTDAVDYADGSQWWSPGQGDVLEAKPEFANAHGRLGLINTKGDRHERSPVLRTSGERTGAPA
jgi:hypothetical protein